MIDAAVKVRMAELTAAEMKLEVGRRPVILLPMGSFEDQGPHAPMGDFLLCDRAAELIARAAAARDVPTLVAPTVPFGTLDFFGSVPGGIALAPETFAALLRDCLRGLLRHGLDRIVIVNGHGGNSPTIHAVTQEVLRSHGVLVPCLYLWQIGHRLLPELFGPEEAARRSGHGADPLTSIGQFLFPSLMRPDLVPDPVEPPTVLGLPVTGFGTVSFAGAPVSVPVESDALAPNGVLGGDPRLSSGEAGRTLVERIVEIGAAFVAHLAAHSDEAGMPARTFI